MCRCIAIGERKFYIRDVFFLCLSSCSMKIIYVPKY